MDSFKYKGVTYKVGDKVLLVNKRPDTWNHDGLMDKYLGKVVTISDIHLNLVDDLVDDIFFEITENNPRKDGRDIKWAFYPNDIGKKVSGTFFKKLPNDFTGTIDVVNGYVLKPQILDEEEKRYLEGVIRPFRDKVKYIIKNSNYTRAYIEIRLESEYIYLPYFKENTMYKGMEIDKRYTLKELGLFDEEQYDKKGNLEKHKRI